MSRKTDLLLKITLKNDDKFFLIDYISISYKDMSFQDQYSFLILLFVATTGLSKYLINYNIHQTIIISSCWISKRDDTNGDDIF